ALEGVRRGETTLDALRPGLTSLAATLESVERDRPKPLSWRTMLNGRTAGSTTDARELRRFILVQPVLDFTALKPGERATRHIREVARASGLDAEHGVRIRLTGNVPMADEEFGTLEEHAGFNASVMLLALLAMLWLAVRSVRAMVAIVACLIVGPTVSAALGLWIYGSFNLISVAFAVLFVGLGVDFGIQYAVAYRATARLENDRVMALRRATLDVGGSLALAAFGIALGFFAFEPTDYVGVSELGVIAGIGMLIAFLASVTLLPALLRLFRVSGMPAGMGFAGLARVDRQLVLRRRGVLIGAGIAAVASIALLPFVRFDFDPLHLRSSETEAVATLMDLARNPQTTPNTIDVLAPSLAAATALGDKLSALTEVSQVLTLASFVPRDQEPKLALIADAALLLEPTLNPTAVQPAPSDDETAQAMRDAAHALQQAATTDPASPAAAEANRVASALDQLASGPARRRQALEEALIPGLRTLLAQLRSSLQAAPVSVATLPPTLVADWIARDGRARIEVFPRDAMGGADSTHSTGANADEAENLRRFIEAVRHVAPEATGTPVSIQEAARTIVHAFIEAGVLALLAITVLLVVVLRRTRDVLITLASLLLGGLVTLAVCVVLRIPLNYENIIALPLLFGIGVAFNIYFVIAWRRGVRDLLQTSLARAVIFSALTTGTAFGSLWLSSHPGTASMGKLLALSLACTLAAALFVLPALLGPPDRGA
ncbi:MAG: MMPL family transporter, partial [Burkholderiaceae bacterium]